MPRGKYKYFLIIVLTTINVKLKSRFLNLMNFISFIMRIVSLLCSPSKREIVVISNIHLDARYYSFPAGITKLFMAIFIVIGFNSNLKMIHLNSKQ